MTKKEFMEKFGDRKTKIKGDVWGWTHWVIPSIFGSDNFAGIDNCGNVYKSSYDDSWDWELYKEPKPEFEFDKPYMWGKNKKSRRVVLMIKTSFMTWEAMDVDSDWDSVRTKKEIKDDYEPISQPDNWRDYGLEEGDIEND